jgi:hypothetical protein
MKLTPKIPCLVVASAALVFASCKKKLAQRTNPESASAITSTDAQTLTPEMSTYADRLNAAKTYKNIYPFSSWIVAGGPPQYTKKNCARVSLIFDRLVAKLISIGKDATEQAKIAAFREAVQALNTLNEEISNLIETEERHNLCELLGHVAEAAGMDHSRFPDEEGAASGRDW